MGAAISQNTEKKNQKRILSQVIDSVGQKYTPDLHIPLPIAEVFEGLGRTKEFFHILKKEIPELVTVRASIERNKLKEVSESNKNELLVDLDRLIKALARIPNSGVNFIPLQEIKILVESIDEQNHELLSLITKAERKDEEVNGKTRDQYSSKYNSESSDLRRLLSQTYSLKKFLDSDSAKCTNNPLLLLTGEAGSGKTHLLCAIAKERLQKNLPTFVFLAEEIHTRDPWKSIIRKIGTTGEDKFLKELNEFAARKKSRALIIVDAINEVPRRVTWELLMRVKKYPWIGLVISVRNGFENEYTTQVIRKSFLRLEHKGFALREWEAVTKYFNEYDIPLPEIPLLLPEFSNPLFLTIFCKTHKGGKKTIKGHSGFTTIFEDYVIEQGNEVLSSFGLPTGRIKGKHSIWDLAFKDVALWMSKSNTERISTSETEVIIKKYFPTINPTLFLGALEKHFLLFRVPHYDTNYKVQGFDYKFPYQKFSDHLIIRYLLKEHLDKVRPESSFKIGQPLGDMVRARWLDYGLIEALSIQIPERLKGRELIFLAPKKFRETDTAKKAFLASLVWRELSIKNGKCRTIKPRPVIDYFNKYLNKTHSDELKNTLISTAPIPLHPFNAYFLHSHLSGLKMPMRDYDWLPFLHYYYGTYGEDSSIDRIIYWSWKRSNSFPLSNESIRLTAIPLAWFLASSNRYLRDKSTKALVSLLEEHIDILIDLLKSFELIDDLYILERLYAVAYGCATRCKNKNDVIKLALYTYETIFSKEKAPVHIILRDYARGVVESGLIHNPRLPIKRKLINPPYGSKWPKTIKSLKYLAKKYESQKIKNGLGQDISAYGQIWYSLMHANQGGMGDFGRYVVESAVSRWIDIPIKKEDIPPTRRKMYREFLKNLNPIQLLQWNKYKRASHSYKKSRPVWAWGYMDDSEGQQMREELSIQEKQLKILRDEFVKSLSKKQRKICEDWIFPYQNRDSHKLKSLDIKMIERLIFSRIIELGWNPELFADFDSRINSRGRDAKKSERIGKKYQWIAFHEVLARIADNYVFKDWSSTKPEHYTGVWQFWDRDLDPSALLNEFEEYENSEKYQISYSNWKPSLAPTEWAKIKSDLPIQSRLLQTKVNKKNDWLILKRWYTWDEPPIPGQEKYEKARKQVWYLVQSYLISRKDATAFFTWGKEQDFMGRWLPESDEMHQIYLREFPHHLAYKNSYTNPNEKLRWQEVENGDRLNKKTGFKVISTDEIYSSELNGFDCSSEEKFKLLLPSKEVYELLRLTPSRIDGAYLQGAETIAFDAVTQKQAPGLMINKEKLQKMLKDNDLELIWVVIGEKLILGGMGNSLGRLEIGGIHRLRSDGEIDSHTYSKYLPPEKQKPKKSKRGKPETPAFE